MAMKVMMPSGRWLLALIAVWALLLLTSFTSAQNLTNEQVAVISQRLAEGAQQSWELGTRSQTILEVNATLYSVFSNRPIPPPSIPPSNLTLILDPFFAIPQNVVTNRPTASNGTVGPQPLIPGDGSAADPASIGMSVLLANWTGQSATLDYAGAARDQLEYLLEFVPRTPDGAISHRVPQVQLWSDFVYMVPPFLAYYGVITENRTLLLEAYNQIKLYRNYLRDSNAQNRWKHVLLGQNPSEPNNDEGHWTTGNGWAAAGILRVLATIRNSQYANTLKGQQKDLGNWVKEIHDGMYAVLDSNVNLFTNYPDIPPNATGNFYDAAGTALLASTVFRGAVMLNQFTHVPAARRIKSTLFSPYNDSSSSSSSTPATTASVGSTSAPSPPSPTTDSVSHSPSSSAAPAPSQFQNYPHITPDGWLTPVVNPDSYGQQGSQSPESEAFALQLHAAWRDWVEDGARGANVGVSVKPFWQGHLGNSWGERGQVIGLLVGFLGFLIWF